MKLTVKAMAETLGQPYDGPDFLLRRAVMDSRTVTEGCLFAAIKGARTDGHRFIPELDRRFTHIAFLVTDPPAQPLGHPVFVVPDIEVALGQLARRSLAAGPKIIGVTGSVGKTTTKELILSLLAPALRVSGTAGNQNNELGVPLTALAADPEDDAAVVEMGMRGLGQIRYLTDFVRPDYAVITNIGTAHLELLGSRENIAKAKLELVDALKPGGCAILPGDEPLLYGARREKQCVYFGFDPEKNDYWADGIKGSTFTLHFPGGTLPVRLALEGRHQILNALAAFAVGCELGLPPGQLTAGLARFTGASGRMSVEELKGITLMDDSYNASPESMGAALLLLAARPHRRVAVLGDMLELGAISEKAHREVAAQCVEAGVDCVIAVGAAAKWIYDALPRGLTKYYAGTTAEAEPLIQQTLRTGDTVLFKASHALGFEKLAQAVRERMGKG